MTIISSELKYYKSKVVGSDASNGGRMSANEVISGVVNNVWPHVLKAEREAGSTLYRKLFAKIANDNDETLLSPDLWNDAPTEAGDYIILFPGTQQDTQATFAGYSGKIYGAANLDSNITAGGSTFDVLLPHADVADMFTDGDNIRLTDKENPDSVTGNEELLTINGVPSLSGLVLTIIVDETIANSYTVSAGGRAMSLYAPVDIVASVDNFDDSDTTSGIYDEGNYPVVIDGIGTVEQEVTLTFTDATHFTATSDDPDVTLGSGVIGSDFSPSNGDFTKPYFTVPLLAWSGTWAAGETVVFQTHPAAAPFILKRIVPAGAASLAGNKNTTVLAGESA